MSARATAILLALVVVSCRSTPIGPPVELAVPQGLTREEVEIAVVTVLAAPQGSRSQPNTHTIVLANPLGAMLWDQYRNSQLPSKHWFLESWEDGEILAGHQRSAHYLRVRIGIEGDRVTLRIVDSKNYDQAEGTIHRNALVWLQRLEIDIREALGNLLILKRKA